MTIATGNTPLDRLQRAVKAAIRELFPTLEFFGFYPYAVTSCDVLGQTVELDAVDASSGVPASLSGIPMRTPVRLNLPAGYRVLVGFAGHDPTQPFIAFYDQITGLDASGAPAFTGLAGALPTDTPPLGAPVARVGDTVGPFIITSGSLKTYSR